MVYTRRSMRLEKKHGFEISRGTHQIIKHLYGRGAGEIISYHLTWFAISRRASRRSLPGGSRLVGFLVKLL